MKTKILFIIILIFISFFGMAQHAEWRTEIRKNERGVIRSVEFSNEDRTVQVPKSADEFFRQVLNTQIADKFEQIPIQSRREGFVHEHFQQYHHGIRVVGGGYNFHFRNGEMFFAHGNYIRIDNLNIRPAITSTEAKISFAQYIGVSLELIVNYYSELIIREITIDGNLFPMLVYRVVLFANHPNNVRIGFVDAQSGMVILTELSFLSFSAHNARFETRFSGVQYNVTTYNYNGVYRLTDATPGRAVIHTWNANNHPMNWANDVAPFRNPLRNNNNNWTQETHRPNNNDMGLDVHWALQQIRDRLFDVHGINSFDNNGATIEAFIRHGRGEWGDNAFWLPNLRVMVFGAGYFLFYPLASVDVVAHEFGHGIVQSQIWLGGTAWDVGCGFNEGMSDIWAIIMNYRIVPEQYPWLRGSTYVRHNSSMRNIVNPFDDYAFHHIACTFNTDFYNCNYVCCHNRSGVFSRWFYFLVNGGNDVNGIGNNFAVNGVGWDIAEELIVNAVFTRKLQFTSTWYEIRENFLVVARALHGHNSAEEIAVANAWHAVGVGNQHVCPLVVDFINQPPVTSDKTIISCGNIYAQNVTITNGAALTLRAPGNIDIENLTVTNNSKLILYAGGNVNLGVGFSVELGSSFSIR
ncbi:MAG: M4 family metallopeptidase [Bacteroidetes bacterium]|nr:M4 family metallopeptidase [Bacteroidota bacterium]